MSFSLRSGGDPDRHALLLIHGLAGTARVWDGLIAQLDPHWHWLAPRHLRRGRR